MKSSKRYLLVSLVLLLATVFCYSLALADTPVTKTTITPKASIDLTLNGDESWTRYVGSSSWCDFQIAYEPAAADPVQIKVYLDKEGNTAEATLTNDGKIYKLTDFPFYTSLTVKKPGKVTIVTEAYDSKGLIEGTKATHTAEFTLVEEDKISFNNSLPLEVNVGYGKELNLKTYVKVEGKTATDVPTYGEDDLKWSSSDDTIATVNSDGLVYGLKAGEVTITATAKGKSSVSGSVKVKVKEAEETTGTTIKTLGFSPKKIELDKSYIDEYFDLYKFLTITDENGNAVPTTSGNVLIESSDTAIVSINSYNPLTVYLKKAGTATVTVTSKKDPTITDTFELTLKGNDATELSLTKDEFTLEKGKSLTLSNYVVTKPTGATATKVYTSDNAGVASVSGGTVTGVKAGTANITVKLSNNPDVKPVTAKITVTDTVVAPTAVTFTPAEITVDATTSVSLTGYYTVTPEDATGVYWSIDNTEIATLTGTTVAAKTNKSGKVTVTAKDKDGKALGTFVINFSKNPATKIIVAQDKLMISKGDNTTSVSDLYKVEPTNADDLVWTSSDAQIAYVDGTTIKVCDHKHEDGVATLTLASKTNPDVKATITVTVVDIALESIKFDQENIAYDYVYTKENVQDLSTLIKYTPEEASDKTLVWSSSDPQIATVASGQITCNKAGEVKITATSKYNPKATATINVKINAKKAPKEIVIAPTAVTIDVADGALTLADYYQVTPLDAAASTVKWISSDKNVAKISDGAVKPVKAGTATLTAQLIYDKEIIHTATLTVTVTDKKAATSFTLVTPTLTVDKSASTTVELADYIVVTPYKDTDTKRGYVWISSDPSVAVINGTTLTVSKVGTATFTGYLAYDGVVVADATPATLTVTVTDTKAPAAIAFAPEAATIALSDTAGFKLSDYYFTSPVDATITQNNLKVTLSDRDVVTVAWNGTGYVVKPTKKGTTTLVASLINNGAVVQTATLTITVTDIPTTAIAFSPAELTVKKGSGDLCVANYKVITPISSNDKTTIYYTSDNPEIASVGITSGLVTGIEIGTATITATVVDKNTDAVLCTGTVKVNVKDIVLTGITFQQTAYTAKLNSKAYVDIGWSYAPVNWDCDLTELEVLCSNTYVIGRCALESNGILTAYANRPGTAVITLKSRTNDAIKAQATITVEAEPITSVKLRKNTLKLYYAETKNMRDNADINHNGGVYQSKYDLKSLLDIQPTNAYIDEVTWETSNSNVAFVYIPEADNTNNSGSSSMMKGSSSSGEVGSIIAVGTGKATVSVIISDGVNTYKKDIDVIVLGKTVSLKLNKSKLTMNLLKGEEVTYQLKAYDDDTDEEVPVKWKSNKTSVATVDANGVVTAVKAGKAVITATTKDGTKTIATCTITVKKNLIKKIKTVDGKKTFTMAAGEVKELMNGDDALLVITPATAFNKTLKYASSNAKVVKVDKTGKMTAVKPGNATVTITATDGSKKSLKLKVTVEKAEKAEAADENYR